MCATGVPHCAAGCQLLAAQFDARSATGSRLRHTVCALHGSPAPQWGGRKPEPSGDQLQLVGRMPGADCQRSTDV